MAKNFDDLIDHLLEEIALCGAPGRRSISSNELFNAIEHAYDHCAILTNAREKQANPSELAAHWLQTPFLDYIALPLTLKRRFYPLKEIT